ncbi:hypothetical protein K6119_11305 [Paracrocinitomix mangrovi]|uniref:hypothetical protein n=1 Tax=Paracrocinitomix mangrovi TaxID=2862509 RepID=UPI001C8EC83F|nr:hypothetical protein [Paracrocinitomix mangrovi]UKN00321.1 hypothetical protein K6119_11305 [Paracrocinitomix mangrovi]
MNKRTGIILRSFARVSVLPILVFSITSWLILKFVEPGTYHSGCLDSPEETRTDLVEAIFLVLIYLGTTPLVLLNFSEKIVTKQTIRISVLLMPLIPVLIGLFSITVPQLIYYDARVFMYLSISAVITTIIILWNARSVNRELKKIR